MPRVFFRMLLFQSCVGFDVESPRHGGEDVSNSGRLRNIDQQRLFFEKGNRKLVARGSVSTGVTELILEERILVPRMQFRTVYGSAKAHLTVALTVLEIPENGPPTLAGRQQVSTTTGPTK